MTTIKFVPQACSEHVVEKGKAKIKMPATFEGHLVMRCPDIDERYGILEDLGLQANEKGEVKSTETNLFASIRKMIKASKPFFHEVHIKRIADGKEFNSFEDLSFDPECDEIILEAARALKEGFRPGKN